MAAWLRTVHCVVFLASASHAAPILAAKPARGQPWRGQLQCNAVETNPKTNWTTCVINATITALSLFLEYPGDVSIRAPADITVQQGDLTVQAVGALTVMGAVAAKVQGHINMTAESISMSGSPTLATRGHFIATSGSIGLSDNTTLDVAHYVNMTAGSVILDDKSVIKTGSGSINIASQQVSMKGEVSITAVQVSITSRSPVAPPSGEAVLASADGYVHLLASIAARDVSVLVEGNVELRGSFVGLKGSRGDGNDDGTWDISVQIVTLRNVTMGLKGGQWNTRQVVIVGSHITVTNQTIHTGSKNCTNNESSRIDQCVQYLEYWPVKPDATWGVSSNLKDTNVTFDLQLIAHGSLTLHSAHLSAISMLMCSGALLDVEASTLDAKGRGCGPGEGPGSGSAGGKVCRAGGGGSHMGRGGSGANYSTTAVAACADAGPKHRAYDLTASTLPTQAASGGGCSLSWPCAPPRETVAAPASAGGLIWLSGHDVVFGADTQVVAGGNRGAATEDKSQSDVSGGGAGGHILLWAYSTLKTDANSPAVLSVDGGNIACSHRQVSGAGGGGFIGVYYVGALDATTGLTLSHRGGAMQDSCQVWPPQAGLSATYGHDGISSSIFSCPAGRSGPLCNACDMGTYANGTSHCLACSNKPAENSEYTEVGWPNSSCPYKCSAGIPDYRTNPKCLPAPSYVFHFFGGLSGALVILVCLVIVSGYFLCRRRVQKPRRRVRQGLTEGGSFLGPCAGGLLTRMCSALRDRLDWCCNYRDFPGEPGLVFTKEQLPYHVCRVYLHGVNEWQFPWGLSSQLPAVVEPLVTTEQWERLATELSAAAEVRSVELFYAAVMGMTAPPFTTSLTCWFRQRRARLLQRCAQRFSEGANCSVFWKPIRARVHPAGELTMIFGCDYGATLGFLDFFDFSRSQLDWAPVDLRQEARLLVAHGQGSYSDPYTIDMGDPLVTHLTQSDFRSVAVCTVISTFNRIARLIRADDLAYGIHSPKVARLRLKVEQCAAQCGLAGFAQVFTCQQHKVASRGQMRMNSSVVRSDTDTSFMDLMLPLSGGAQGSPLASQDNAQASPPVGHYAGSRAPFLLPAAAVQQSPPAASSRGGPMWAASQASSRGIEVGGSQVSVREVGSQASARGIEAGQASPGQAHRAVEVKLCLAFVDPSALSVTTASLAQSPRSAPPEALLTSPMARAILGEQLDQMNVPNLVAITESPSFARAPRWRWPLGEEHGSTTPATVLLVVIMLFFVDLMAFIIVGAMIVKISYIIFAIWVLVPPFTQPVAVVLGPLFMLTEMPRLGRLYASLTICGTVSAAVATVALLTVQLVDSWFFNFAELLTVCIVKAALYLFVHMHVRNLEAAWDMSFTDAPQGDFVGELLAAETSGRQVSLPTIAVSIFDRANYTAAPGVLDRPDLGRDSEERSQGKPATPQRRSFTREGDSPSWSDSFLHPPSLRSSEETQQGKYPLSLSSAGDTIRPSSGGRWEVLSSSASPAEPAPF